MTRISSKFRFVLSVILGFIFPPGLVCLNGARRSLSPPPSQPHLISTTQASQRSMFPWQLSMSTFLRGHPSNLRSPLLFSGFDDYRGSGFGGGLEQETLNALTSSQKSQQWQRAKGFRCGHGCWVFALGIAGYIEVDWQGFNDASR